MTEKDPGRGEYLYSGKENEETSRKFKTNILCYKILFASNINFLVISNLL